MVCFATLAEADVVHGGSGIDGRSGFQLHGACYDASCVVASVCGVEGVVLREHRLLHPCLEGSGHCVVAPPLVGYARAAVGHVHNAAVYEPLFVCHVSHGGVAGVCVETQVVALLFGEGEGCRPDAVSVGVFCYAVNGGVRCCRVYPTAMIYHPVGGLHAWHHGEGANGLAVVLDDVRGAACHVVGHVVASGVAHPLYGVAVGAHNAARVVVHREYGLDVVCCGGAYLHGQKRWPMLRNRFIFLVRLLYPSRRSMGPKRVL